MRLSDFDRDVLQVLGLLIGLPLVCALLAGTGIFLHYQWHLWRHAQDPVQLLEYVRKPGANDAVSKLSDNEFVWDNILEGVKSGDARWLAVANELSTSGSAHSSEELFAALSVVLEGAKYLLAN